MFSLELRAGAEEKDLLSAELWELGCTGITELETGLRAFFEPGVNRAALLERFAEYEPIADEQPERDWIALSRAGWKPKLAGSRFFLVPFWIDAPTPEGRFRIEVNPGLACGTGYHEATELCLEALERRLRPGMTVLDVGTGSGILSIAARLLGAGRVTGCDLDEDAVRIARENLARARADAKVFRGSLESVRDAVAGLIVVNISAAADTALAPDLARCAAPGGVVLACGFGTEESAGVQRALAASGLTVEGEFTKGEWALVEASLS
jgi:ribosomal protein L11 methyltransferase